MNLIPPPPKIFAIIKFHLAYYALIWPTNGEGGQGSSQKWSKTFLQETRPRRLTYGCDPIHYVMHSLSLSIKTNARPRGHCVLCETESPEGKHQLTFLSCCPGKLILTGLNNFLPPSLKFPFRITDRTYHSRWDGQCSIHELQIQSRETGRKRRRQLWQLPMAGFRLGRYL